MAPNFRYLLGFQVPADRAGWLARHLPPLSRNLFTGLSPHRYHLTLCTIAETPLPHPFLRQRVAHALAGALPATAAIPFGRIVAGEAGVELVTAGSIGAVRDFYDAVAARLAAEDLAPLHRKSGLRPHITLGYGEAGFDPVPLAWTWTPGELVLIESHIGHDRHRRLQGWALPAPAQGRFDFMADDLPPVRRAA